MTTCSSENLQQRPRGALANLSAMLQAYIPFPDDIPVLCANRALA